WVVPTADVYAVVPDERLGLEIQSPEFTLDEFRTRLAARKNARLKPLLLDQALVAGLGNIYVDESLWGAGLHPLRTAGSLDEAETARLYESIREVIHLALTEGVARVLNGRAVAGATLPRPHGHAGEPSVISLISGGACVIAQIVEPIRTLGSSILMYLRFGSPMPAAGGVKFAA